MFKYIFVIFLSLLLIEEGSAQTRPTATKKYKIIVLKHVYAGGLAKLFVNTSVIRTEDFVTPAYNNPRNNRNQNSFNQGFGNSWGNNNRGRFGF